MRILTIAAIVLSVPGLLLAGRYNLHMFQLDSYMNVEHMAWLKKNWKKQGLLLMQLALGVLAIFIRHVATFSVLILMDLIITRYYFYLKKNNTKKKLVYTMRVRRQIATNIILAAVIIALVDIFAGFGYLPGTLAVITGLQMFNLFVIVVINKPLEKMVTNHFINDAKRRLHEVPDLKIIGITGSYGKTSMKYYLQTLLQDKFNVLITPESYNTPMGIVKTIRSSLKPTHELFICEMGAKYVGDIKEICDIVHPDHGVISSIGPQHLETFGNMDNIISTKFELADAIPEGGMLFLNGDNEYITGNSKKYSSVFYRSKSSGDGYTTSDVSLSQLGTEFTVTAPSGESERFQMKLVGEHNIINVVGAIAVANSFGIPLKSLKTSVRRIQPVQHRMQMIRRGNVTIIDDAYNSNPVGSKAAVETLNMLEGVRILVTPGMVELGRDEDDFNYKFGTYAAQNCDYILLVGKKHTEPIYKGVMDSGFPQEKCAVFDKLEEALSYAYSIKGEGHKYILLENDLPDNY